MAEIYRKPQGCPQARGVDPLNWVIARHFDVQFALQEAATTRGAVAESVLASHRKTGAARIEVRRGVVDRYVMLVDEGGPSDSDSLDPKKQTKFRALAIELGAEGGRGGVHALGTAFPEAGIGRK